MHNCPCCTHPHHHSFDSQPQPRHRCTINSNRPASHHCYLSAVAHQSLSPVSAPLFRPEASTAAAVVLVTRHRHPIYSFTVILSTFSALHIVDAVHSALNAMGYKDIEIVVAETGWPYRGDTNEVGPSVENAKAYNGGLINHLRSMVGTPLMPGKSVDTYIFALYDEDLKPGPTSEKSFGLFKPDLSMTYDVGLSKSSTQTPSTSPSTPSTTPSPSTTPATPSPKPTQGGWCVPKQGVSDAQLQANLDYACGHGIDCTKIQPGGVCYNPNTVASHAAYAMNLYYQMSGRNPVSCDFSQTATVTDTNPSYNGCEYPDGTGTNTRVSLGVPVNNSVDRRDKNGRWCWWCYCVVLLSLLKS